MAHTPGVEYLVICAVASFAAGLTFFTGFGLGTLLLPAVALFMPLEQAVAITAVVHLLNGLFKLSLVRGHIERSVLVAFGLPAMLASLLGAWALLRLAEGEPVLTYVAGDREFAVTPLKLAIGGLLLLFASAELLPRLRALSFPARYLPLGGALSGFLGGLSGMQGALRSAFLVRAGLTKEGFIGTGAALAVLIDLTRLGIYLPALLRQRTTLDHGLLAAAVLAAFGGALLGNRFLPKVTAPAVQAAVALLLFVVAIGMMSGAL